MNKNISPCICGSTNISINNTNHLFFLKCNICKEEQKEYYSSLDTAIDNWNQKEEELFLLRKLWLR